MNILLGYLLNFGWIFFMIFALGGVIAKKTNTETSRKIIHTSLFMVWVLIDLFLKNTVHQIILPVVFIIINALSYKFKFYSGVEREDENHPGTIYFAIAVTAVMAIGYFLPQTYIYTGVACFCLTFGDGCAALVGYNVKSPKIRNSKSLAGFLSCFAAGCFAMIAFKLIYMRELLLSDCVLIGAVCAVSELTGGGLDNFTVTFSTFAAGMLLSSNDARFALMWGLVIFCIVFFTKAITYFGALLAMAMVYVFRYFGGNEGLLFFAGCYFIVFAAGIAKAKLKGRKRHEGRGLKQIAINGGLGTVLMLLYGLTGQVWLMLTAITSIGGNFIDSVSSDVGCISKKKPYDFFRKEYVATGLSGGMSVLGTSAAFICSVMIGLFVGFVLNAGAVAAVMSGVIVFAQTLLDSAMGSRLQVKRICTVCGETTEDGLHCGQKTEFLRGISWIDNNMVNLISSGIITLIAAAVFAVIK